MDIAKVLRKKSCLEMIKRTEYTEVEEGVKKREKEKRVTVTR